MNKDEIDRLVRTDPDYIAIKRFEYSIDKLIERYADGAPNRIIALALNITEPEVEQLYQQIIEKLREKLT